MRQAGAVVPIQTVASSAETDVRTIRKLSAEMFTSSVSVATTIGGQTCCVESQTQTKSLVIATATSTTVMNVHTKVSAVDIPLSQLCPWKPGAHLQA